MATNPKCLTKTRQVLFWCFFGLLLGQCKTPITESPAFQVIRNASAYTVNLEFVTDTDTVAYLLAPEDSVLYEGMCYRVENILDCEVFWLDRSEYRILAAVLTFDEEKVLVYEPAQCTGSRNLLGGAEFPQERCGYRLAEVRGELASIFDITAVDYDMAEPIDNGG